MVCPLSNIQIITSSLQFLTKWHILGLHTFDSIELGAVGQICLVCHNEGQGQKWYQSPRLAGSSKTVINQNFPDYVVKKSGKIFHNTKLHIKSMLSIIAGFYSEDKRLNYLHKNK